MSIIQEALEKAQSSVKPSDGLEASHPAKSAEVPPPPHAKPVIEARAGVRPAVNVALPTAVLIIMAICAIILGAKFLSKAAMPGTTRDESAQEISYRPIVKNDAINRNPLINNVQQSMPPEMLKPVSSPDLVLNGIMHLDDGPRAIINNAIVGAGDSVSGAKVIKINSQSVVLEYRDVEITLSLK